MNIPLVATDVIKWIAFGPTKIQAIHGMNNQSGILYIQFHEVPPLAAGTLTAGAVPAYKSLQVAANAPFYFALNSTLKECLYVVSSTEATYTAVASPGGLDATLECQSDFLCNGTEVVVGDLTTARNGTLTMWADGSGPKTLLRLDVVELLGATRFFGLSTTNAATGVDSSRVDRLPASTTVSLFYGTPAIPVTGLSSAFVQTKAGFVFVMDSVPSGGVDYAPVPFSSGNVTNSSFACRGIYR